MTSLISREERKKLYLEVRTIMGWPARDVNEISDTVLDVLFGMSLEDYSSHVQNWLVEQQWGSLQGLEVDSANFVYALTTKTLDWEHSFAYAYSKQTGANGNGPWELKKDYVVITAGTQTYEVPAGREINEVLWTTPSAVGGGGVENASNWSAGQFGWQYAGNAAEAILPAFGMLLSAQDRTLKRRILQSEMSYRITGGPNGTKLLHLYPVPGSKNEIRGPGGKSVDGSMVWYWYYETNNKGRKKCLEINDDIVKLPDDVPLQKVKWEKLNNISRARIRKFLTAKAANYIAKARGKFKGKIMSNNASTEMEFDYQIFLDESKEIMTEVLEEIKTSLDKISNVNLMKDRADIAENLNRVLKHEPIRNQFVYH